ncbi:MAG TPA: cytochrome-c oxidase, cbb3-type subunit III [Dokdonella sp.]
MSTPWALFVIVLTLLNIVLLAWLLFANARSKPDPSAKDSTTGHVWDGDLAELNNPLPRWWFGLFVATIVFSIGYLVLYPGLGNFAGTFRWTSLGEADREVAATREQLDSLFARFRDRPIDELAADPAATKVGRNVFANNCAACHGSDARGAKGYPNLVDEDSLYGADADTMLASVLGGRHGIMPPLAAALPDGGVDEVAHYALSLSGLAHDAPLAAAGKPKFEAICSACHGIGGTGNPLLGAPNLTDDVWLYGRGDLAAIRTAIENGRAGVMPAWGPLLGEDRARLAVAWLISQREQPVAAAAASAAPGASP